MTKKYMFFNNLKTIISLLSLLAKKLLRRLIEIARALPYHGEGRFCPICGKSSSKFKSFGAVSRFDAECPNCGSLERHRLLWLYITRKTNLFDEIPKKMLHVAPERCLETRIKKRIGKGYLSADLFAPRAMVKMDITNIEYPNNSFDVIYCSHVLEHIHDDKRAMRELFRVLKNNGWAILLVPIMCAKTFEDSSIIEPSDRLKAFGQKDHVRSYGLDYVDRLCEAGFIVEVIKVTDFVQDDEVEKMGLKSGSGEIYFCTKGTST